MPQRDESTLTIAAADGVSLEGRLAGTATRDLGVVCHPHPQFGGSMDNNVVLAACRALQELGLGSLRFNFRGVGASTGEHGGGAAEVTDVVAACAAARSAGAGGPPHLIGYSFGSRVALMALQTDLEVASAVLVAPPVDVMDFAALRLPDVPGLVVVGDGDSFCSAARLRRWLTDQRGPEPELVVLSGVDHFYLGHEAELQAALQAFLAPRSGGEAPP